MMGDNRIGTPLTVTAHLDGFALRFGSEVLGVFRTLSEAGQAKREAERLSNLIAERTV
jgi:hypothetical protein